MTVHREQNMKREDQQDATIRCLLLTSVSTCFGHHYAYLQENKDRVTAFDILLWFCWMWLVAVVRRCVVGCEHCEQKPSVLKLTDVLVACVHDLKLWRHLCVWIVRNNKEYNPPIPVRSGAEISWSHIRLRPYNFIFTFLIHTTWYWLYVQPKHVAALDLL